MRESIIPTMNRRSVSLDINILLIAVVLICIQICVAHEMK